MSNEMFSLRGRRALITGASRGIGRAIAAGLAEAGAEVILVSRDQQELQRFAQTLQAEGASAYVDSCDVSSCEEIHRLFRRLEAADRQPEILVNNAATIRRNPPEETTAAELSQVLDTNVKGTFLMAKEASRRMIAKGYGKIINLSSVVAFGGGARASSYAASKGAITALTQSLATAWACHGIRVNAIAPGYVQTDMTDVLYKDEGVRDALLQRIPLGRWGRPGDLIGAAVFLASSASDYITGHTLVVDGGWLAS